MLRIVQRLLAAASDAKIRHDMNVEDEFFSVIEKRDTDLMLKDKKIAEQITQIAEKNSQIAEQNTQIAEQSNQIAEQSNQIAEQNTQIAEQNTQIAEQWSTICTSVKMLHSAGMSAESIAMNLNLDLPNYKRQIKIQIETVKPEKTVTLTSHFFCDL